ncbi:MAG: helix-turn-helix domain-containing protein, partial [Acidobacteriota bacterium]
ENLCKRFVIVGSETQILRELSNHRPGQTSVPALLASHEPSAPTYTGPSHIGEHQETSDLSLLEVGRRAAWEAERRAIQQMLEETHWNRREASRRLQVSYKALLNKIKQMQLEDNATKGLGIESVQEKPTTH